MNVAKYFLSAAFHIEIYGSRKKIAPDEIAPSPSSNANPKPNPNRGTIFLGGNFPGTEIYMNMSFLNIMYVIIFL